MNQLTFDIDQMIHDLDVQTLPEWDGAPLHFTIDYYAPAALSEAFDRYIFINGRFGCLDRSRMWTSSISLETTNTDTTGHSLHILSADQNTVIEKWHDHAWPGWRHLPVVPVPINQRTMGKASDRWHKWIEANYPDDWQTRGAPIVTDRGGPGTGHVPHRSPWAGFELSHDALTRPR